MGSIIPARKCILTYSPIPPTYNIYILPPFPAITHSEDRGGVNHFLVAIRDHMRRNRIEVVVLVEGIDPVSGSTVQARHSYTAGDIAWQAKLTECVQENYHGGLVVDFARFHHVHSDEDEFST
jgi:hypothetical protein